MTPINESTVFEIIPYIGTNLVSFGMSALQVEERLGKSEKKSRNHQGKQIEFWSYMNIGYSERGVVEHIGFGRQMKNILLNHNNLFGLDAPMVLKKLREIDCQPLEYLGGLFFFKLGICLTGFHDDDEDQKAMSLFEDGRWDSRKSKMRKINLFD